MLRTGGYVIDFWGLGHDVAERIGLIPAHRDGGYRIEEVQLVDAAARRVAGFDAGAFRSATGDRFIRLPRSDLSRRIYDLIDGAFLFARAVADSRTSRRRSVREAVVR